MGQTLGREWGFDRVRRVMIGMLVEGRCHHQPLLTAPRAGGGEEGGGGGLARSCCGARRELAGEQAQKEDKLLWAVNTFGSILAQAWPAAAPAAARRLRPCCWQLLAPLAVRPPQVLKDQQDVRSADVCSRLTLRAG